MFSGFCKSQEHAGCAPHGKMISPNGKKFRCECECHVRYRKQREAAKLRAERERDEEDDE